MKSKPVPKQCKSCPHFHTGGIKEGGYDRWCCHFGKTAPAAIGQCENTGFRKGEKPAVG
jgi:hypothetical protein